MGTDLKRFRIRVILLRSSKIDHGLRRPLLIVRPEVEGREDPPERELAPVPRKRDLGWTTPARLTGLPRFWELFSYILSDRVRLAAFEPSFNVFLRRYQEARRKYRTKWSRRWLAVAFTFQTLWMIVGCLNAAGIDKVLAVAWGLRDLILGK